MSRCDAKTEGERKMRRKILEIYETENIEATKTYLYAVGTIINDLNGQMEEVY